MKFTHDKIPVEDEMEIYETLLMNCLKNEVETDYCYMCTECGHSDVKVVPNYLAMSYRGGGATNGIRLHLSYSHSPEKVVQIRVEYDCSEDGYSQSYDVKRGQEIYKRETEKDLEMRFGDVSELPKHYYAGNFYYEDVVTKTSKRLHIRVEDRMGYCIWGCNIYTRDPETGCYTESLDFMYAGAY
jgi:hypothetical protein